MKLTIIGASGHGKVVAEIAELCGYDEIEFLDDNVLVKKCLGWPVVGDSQLAKKVKNDIFVAIGNAEIRQRLMDELNEKNMPILIHPSAVISRRVQIGRGSVIMAGAVINSDVQVGKGCIVNTASSVDHDCTIGDYVHIAVGAHLCGKVSIGNMTWIGAGTTVSNNIQITGGCMIGAGATVINDILKRGTYVGVPAKIKYFF